MCTHVWFGLPHQRETRFNLEKYLNPVFCALCLLNVCICLSSPAAVQFNLFKTIKPVPFSWFSSQLLMFDWRQLRTRLERLIVCVSGSCRDKLPLPAYQSIFDVRLVWNHMDDWSWRNSTPQQHTMLCSFSHPLLSLSPYMVLNYRWVGDKVQVNLLVSDCVWHIYRSGPDTAGPWCWPEVKLCVGLSFLSAWPGLRFVSCFHLWHISIATPLLPLSFTGCGHTLHSCDHETLPAALEHSAVWIKPCSASSRCVFVKLDFCCRTLELNCWDLPISSFLYKC